MYVCMYIRFYRIKKCGISKLASLLQKNVQRLLGKPQFRENLRKLRRRQKSIFCLYKKATDLNMKKTCIEKRQCARLIQK